MLNRFYIWMLRKFLGKQSVDELHPTNAQIDESLDIYYVYLKQDSTHITLTHLTKDYVLGYYIQNDHPQLDSKYNRKIPVGIKLSTINWSLVFCHHYYKVGRRIKHSFKYHVVRFCLRKYWFEWQRIKWFDRNIKPVSDRYEILTLIDKKHSEGSVTYCRELMEHCYGKQVHASTKQYEIRCRLKSIVQSLVDDGYAKFEHDYLNFTASILPKGIAELDRHREENRKHAESARTAKSMETATRIMAIAVAIQAMAAVLTYAKLP